MQIFNIEGTNWLGGTWNDKIVLKGFFKNNWSQKTGNWEYVVRGKEKNREGECLENRKRELLNNF